MKRMIVASRQIPRKFVEASMAPEEVEDAIMNNRPFDLDSFRKYRGYDKYVEDNNIVQAQDVQVGKVYKNTEDASEMNLGDEFKVLSINHTPGGYWEYTFHVKDLTNGMELDLHYWADDYVGPEI